MPDIISIPVEDVKEDKTCDNSINVSVFQLFKSAST